MNDMQESKVCTRCGANKLATREFFGSTPSGGLRGYCRTCMNAASKLRDTSHPNERQKRDAKRSEVQGGSRFAYETQLKRALHKRQNGLCPCCFEPIATITEAEVDHMVPLARKGSDETSNQILTHARCNREKHNKTLPEHWEWRVKVGLDSENMGRKHGLIT